MSVNPTSPLTYPPDWRVTTLSKVATFHNGREFPPAKPDGPAYPVFGSGGRFDWSDSWLHNGASVLFGRKGTIDKPLLVDGKFWTVDTMFYTTVDSKAVIPPFLYYWATRIPFEYYSTGTALPSMTQSDLGREKIGLPSLGQQNKIVNYLDHETAEIDALISDQGALIELLNERFNSQLSNAWGSNEDNLDRLRLKDYGITKRSGVSVNGSTETAGPKELGVLRTGAVSKGYFDPSSNKTVIDPHEIARLATPVRANTLLVNRANTPELVGTTALVQDSHSNLFLSDLLWEITVSRATPEYIYWYSKTKQFREQLSLIKVGASQTMQKIRFEDFARLEIARASKEQQEEISRGARQAWDVMKESTEMGTRAIALARERRAALIMAAVTGQIDVTARNKPAAEQLEDDIAQGLHREN